MADISYDRFIRTSDKDHILAVQTYWTKLVSRGVIKEGKHTGYYSVNEESFIAEKDLIHKEQEGYYETEAGERVEKIDEKNYVFEITEDMRDRIAKWLEAGTVKPEFMR